MSSAATRKWRHGLGAALITGFSTSFTSALGISGASAVGVPVTNLDAKQLGVITLVGGLVGMAAYLRQSPLPPVEE